MVMIIGKEKNNKNMAASQFVWEHDKTEST